jgi:AraC-like DNA-binding protein
VPLVRACAVIPFVRFLEEVGAPVDRHLADAELSAVPLDKPEELVLFRQVLRFVNRAAAGEGIEHLGLLVGEKTEIADLGVMGRVFQRSVTLNSALATAIEVLTCFNSGERIWLAHDNDRVLICHALVFSADEAWHGHLFAMMLLIKLIRLFAGNEWWPREIRLPKTELVRRTFYEASLRTIVTFHEPPVFAIVIEPPLLARARVEFIHRETSACDDIAVWRSSAPAIDLPGSLRQAVGALLPGGYPDIRVIANLTGMNVRSLQRRLAEEGESYSHLVAHARFEMAVRLLRDGHVKLIDIGYELGYTDPANFTRAFRQGEALHQAGTGR